ncbi:MAG: hypothetical protein QF735_03180, partial [Phycisphaeraceae bacterium]|nr:hypothetical protein [Phycisphaeraceae bacterium]
MREELAKHLVVMFDMSVVLAVVVTTVKFGVPAPGRGLGDLPCREYRADTVMGAVNHQYRAPHFCHQLHTVEWSQITAEPFQAY